MVIDPYILLPIIISGISAIATFTLGTLAEKYKIRRVPEALSFIGLGATFASVLYLLYRSASQVLTYSYVFGPPSGAMLEADLASLFMAALISGLGFVVTIYSIGYMKHDTGLPKYYSLLQLLVTGMTGVVFAGDLFTLFVFFEMMAICSYVLVAFRKSEWEPVEAGMKYLFMGALGSTTVLYAISFLYGITGTLNIGMIGTQLRSGLVTPGVVSIGTLLIVLLIGGFGVKAAIVPMHTWLIDAHPAAPSGISSMLSGVVIETALFALIRILFVDFPYATFDWRPLIGFIAIITMIVASISALMQTDLKRLLAYSSILNIGFILIGFAVVTSSNNLGPTASFFQILNHAIAKGLLFLCAGAFLHAAGTRDLGQLSGIGKKMPWTALAFGIGAFAIAGVPPLNGFYSKILLLWSAAQLGGLIGYSLLIFGLFSSAIAIYFYLRIVQTIAFGEPSRKLSDVKEAPRTMLFGMLVLAALCIIIGVYPTPFYNFVQQVASALANFTSYITPP
ncbi:MAG: proton-conducting transporter membrane subunit [Promethearchaeati archaeon SRVP18_Atabeyarchaeia-1]